MNILLVGNFTTAWDGSICDEVNVAKALESLGNKVFRFQRELTTEAYWKLPRCDIALVFQWDGYKEDLVGRVKNLIAPTVVYWAFDYQGLHQAWHERLVETADLYLSKRIADSRYPNWRWACDFAPDFLGKYDQPIEKDIDVLFTGSYLKWAIERNDTLKMLDENFNVHIYSTNEWPLSFQHRSAPVLDYGLPELIARSKVCIAIDHTLEAGYWSDRAAQIISCGGFCLQRYIPLMESYFHNNIAYFYNMESAYQQTKWWLEHDEDRETFALNAFENSAAYKCQQRVSDVLTTIRSVL